MGGRGGGLEDVLSRELAKASLKTIPCLRLPLALLLVDNAPPPGIDLGELCADIVPNS